MSKQSAKLKLAHQDKHIWGKRLYLWLALLFGGGVLFYLFLLFIPVSDMANENKILQNLEGDVQRGMYLANIAGCVACHTNQVAHKDANPPIAGGLLAGGAPIETKFGVFNAPNITFDKEFGIGDWSILEFERAVRHGVSPQGEPYYPAFPYAFYAQLTDQDIADLWAALTEIPAQAVASKEQVLNFPFNFRKALKIWQWLFVDNVSFIPDATRGENWNRGKYLVDVVAHCGACHTPRGIMGNRLHDAYLSGADGLPGGSKAPAITPHALKENGYSQDDLITLFQIGMLPDGDFAGGSMEEAISLGTSLMTAEDQEAIAHYLLNKP